VRTEENVERQQRWRFRLPLPGVPLTLGLSGGGADRARVACIQAQLNLDEAEALSLQIVNRQAGYESCQRRNWVTNKDEVEKTFMFGREDFTMVKYWVTATVRIRPDGKFELRAQDRIKFGIRGKLPGRPL
jgi:hypothetical protein